MGWLSWLGIEDSTSAGFQELGRRAERLDAPLSRRCAAFAGVLARVARADLVVTPDESAEMIRLVADFGDLEDQEAALIVDTAVELSSHKASSGDYLATRELRQLMSDRERDGLLRCLFAVSAADDSVSLAEEEEIRQIANELGFEHEEYVRARSEVGQKRSVLRSVLRD